MVFTLYFKNWLPQEPGESSLIKIFILKTHHSLSVSKKNAHYVRIRDMELYMYVFVGFPPLTVD